MTKIAVPKGITTRVTDISSGGAAVGVPIRLERHVENKWQPVAIAITNERGRAHLLGEADDESLEKDDYRLTFEIAAYFKARKVTALFPFVQLTLSITGAKHYHVPLALGPFGFSIHGES